MNVILLTLTRACLQTEDQLSGIDASIPRMAVEKAKMLRSGEVVVVGQQGQSKNPDARVTLDETTFSLGVGMQNDFAGVLRLATIPPLR